MAGLVNRLLAQVALPSQSSTFAPEHDWIWNFLILVSLFFTILIMGLLIFFLIRHRQRGVKDRAAYAQGATHSTPLEMTWIVVPLVVVLASFVFGFRAFLNMSQPRENAKEILVIGQQWNWTFQYENGATSPDSKLHIPVDTPVRLVLQSNDVLHSVFVPAFRAKKDVVPGRYNKMWFEATETGEFPLYCAEYCGRDHAAMLSSVVVHSQAEYEQWANENLTVGAPDMAPAEYGRQIYEQYCQQCHTAEGSGGATGPAWDDLFGTEEPLASGQTVMVDEDYVRESILYPNRQKTQGFENQVMPPFGNVLNEYQITAIIAYMKSISDEYDGPIRKGFEEEEESGGE